MEMLDRTTTNSDLEVADLQMQRRNLRFGGGGFWYDHFYTPATPSARHNTSTA
jgi:hypothetical protein